MDVKPDDIRAVHFKGARLGRKGYDAEEVDRFLERVRGSMARLARENRNLTLTSNSSELARLQRENMQLAAKSEALQMQMQTMASAGSMAELQQQLANAHWEIARLQGELEKDELGISARAVHVLNRAQLSADAIVDNAEQHARDLMSVARAQQRELLQRARESAGSTRSGGYLDPELEDQRHEQLRAYSELLRTQLQAMIATLNVEVDKLALLPLPGTALVALQGDSFPSGLPAAERAAKN
ncbi:DivIVA domain-containing protein [Nocardia seriolae]|uniref:DivIVA domain-containing protein n=1 Tax=Nocardia seriolae TaxID=37332 RepID=UPI00051A36D6|nr:DivIVA domain-containing protein [Nocardia seriolae]MTJ61907.1 DivIVA domain-containing protein [Nocardia seriolae]MTJ74993.1 DivIVA domain-containing protein [Nocardia seriolae]MTJ90064.1 DivIVA domain-containing protein [Nocardia seriolae]MTK34037.1 DivIVA domain-containing protein [Nocardia seriolae]MTK39857.1 DivIVA domain-containing protein [Nocardia seriolae]